MTCELSSVGHKLLFDEDIEWLMKQPRSVERDHIRDSLIWLRDNRTNNNKTRED